MRTENKMAAASHNGLSTTTATFTHDFIEALREADPDRRLSETFTIFLRVTHAMLYQTVRRLFKGRPDPVLEEEGFCKPLRQLKSPHSLERAMGLLARALDAEPRDWLGDVYMAVGLGEKDRSQFFTPTHPCRLMTQLNLDGNTAPDPANRFSAYEPACGGGGLFIALAEELGRRGFQPKDWYVYAEDKDELCVQMSYIQASVLRIPAGIALRDSLCPKDGDPWYPTLHFGLYPPGKPPVDDFRVELVEGSMRCLRAMGLRSEFMRKAAYAPIAGCCLATVLQMGMVPLQKPTKP